MPRGLETTTSCMQQQEVANQKCNRLSLQILLRTPYRPEKCEKEEVFWHVAKTKNATTKNCMQHHEIATRLHVCGAPGPGCHCIVASAPLLCGPESGKGGWSSEGSEQSHPTSCQKVAPHWQLQMLRDFQGQEEEEEVRGRRER